jgi:hypothetical protein
MKVRDTIDCCNYVELCGFNGWDNPADWDLHDPESWNKRAGVLAIAERAGAHEGWGEYGEVGSVLMTVAWDNPDEEHWTNLNDYYMEDHYRDRETLVPRMEAMRRYIRYHGLGTTHKIPDTINPNHGTGIMTVIWHVNYVGLAEWWDKIGCTLRNRTKRQQNDPTLRNEWIMEENIEADNPF